MKVDNLKDLEAVLKLCRRMGVNQIDIDGISLRLEHDMPSRTQKADTSTKDKIDTGPQWSDEDLLLWSASPNGAE